MSATLYQQQREHIASLQRAYQQCLATHQLDSLAIYSGHARYHFADDHTTTFRPQIFGTCRHSYLKSRGSPSLMCTYVATKSRHRYQAAPPSLAM